MWQELIQRFSLSITVDEVLSQDRSLYHERLKNEPDLEPIPGVKDLIQDLHRKQVGLVLASSSSMESINLILDLFDLSGFFDHRVSGADLQFSKPHPEIFHVAAGFTGTDSNHCLVIEDSNHGVTAAKRANMKCIGFLNPNSGNQDLNLADLIIDDFSQLTYDQIMQLGRK
jgi:HAD superfamily hydrolase (TIGR01509 family)